MVHCFSCVLVMIRTTTQEMLLNGNNEYQQNNGEQQVQDGEDVCAVNDSARYGDTAANTGYLPQRRRFPI